jgi:hypothetical protein
MEELWLFDVDGVVGKRVVVRPRNGVRNEFVSGSVGGCVAAVG